MNKNITRLVAIAVFGVLTLAAYATELKNVTVSSVRWGNQPTLTFQYQSNLVQGNFIGTQFFKLVNGRPLPITQQQAAALIHPGSRMNLTVERRPNGIIAILIGLLVPA